MSDLCIGMRPIRCVETECDTDPSCTAPALSVGHADEGTDGRYLTVFSAFVCISMNTLSSADDWATAHSNSMKDNAAFIRSAAFGSAQRRCMRLNLRRRRWLTPNREAMALKSLSELTRTASFSTLARATSRSGESTID